MAEKRVWFANGKPNNLTDGLVDLIKEFKPGVTMAEVGCFAGVSTSVFVDYCDHVYAVDCWADADPGYMEVTKEDLQKAEDIFRKRFESAQNLTIIKKNSVDASNDFASQSLDVVYLDGDHRMLSVMADIMAWKPKVRTGGILCGHDYQQPEVHLAVNSILGIPYKLFQDSSWMVKIA